MYQYFLSNFLCQTIFNEARFALTDFDFNFNPMFFLKDKNDF